MAGDIDWKGIRKVAEDLSANYDASPITWEKPLNPVPVYDVNTPQAVDPRYRGFRGFVRKYVSPGPGTTTYDTSRYKPSVPGDYVIGIGGAGSGVGGTSDDFQFRENVYGSGNTAWFTWRQLDEAEKYIRSLPKGSRVNLFGYSMGVDGALDLARRLKASNIPVASLSLRDGVRRRGRLRNFFKGLMGTPQENPSVPSNVSKANHIYNPGWFQKVNPLDDYSDYVSLMGGRLGPVKGARNRAIPLSHRQLGEFSFDSFIKRRPDEFRHVPSIAGPFRSNGGVSK